MDGQERGAARPLPVGRESTGDGAPAGAPAGAPRTTDARGTRIGWTLSVVLGVSLPMLALGLTVGGLTGRPAVGWRGTYTHQDVVGVPHPMVRVDRELRFDWGKHGPGGGIPPDGFRVTWVTCLNLPAPETLRFRLESDDGSRLFLDGRLLVDNWRNQDLHGESRRVDLPAGSHPLRVDYYESRGSARVTLEILREGGRAGSIDAAWLRPPSDSATACE